MFEITKNNCPYFTCYLFHKRSEIIVENVSITLFRVTTMVADIFYPIFTLTITILACFTRKQVKLFRGFSPTLSPRHRPRPPGGAYSSPQSPSFNRFWLSKNRCAHIFSALSPALYVDLMGFWDYIQFYLWKKASQTKLSVPLLTRFIKINLRK